MTEPHSKWVPRVPGPLQRLFDHFPLAVLDRNELPVRSPAPSELPTLHVFLTEADALRGLPSFNPTCLKWQVRLNGKTQDSCPFKKVNKGPGDDKDQNRS